MLFARSFGFEKFEIKNSFDASRVLDAFSFHSFSIINWRKNGSYVSLGIRICEISLRGKKIIRVILRYNRDLIYRDWVINQSGYFHIIEGQFLLTT